MKRATRRRVRRFAIEMVIYGVLVILFLYLVIFFLADWLTTLYSSNLLAYAIIALILIIAQSALLDFLTTFIMDRLGLRRRK
jgi:cation transporter-like permease